MDINDLNFKEPVTVSADIKLIGAQPSFLILEKRCFKDKEDIIKNFKTVEEDFKRVFSDKNTNSINIKISDGTMVTIEKEDLEREPKITFEQ